MIAANAVLQFLQNVLAVVAIYVQQAVTAEMVVIADLKETVVKPVIAAIYARQATYEKVEIAAIYVLRAIANDCADSEMATMSHPNKATCNHCAANGLDLSLLLLEFFYPNIRWS